MRDFIIAADNAADLYFGYYENNPALQVPMPFTIDGKDYEHEKDCPSMMDFYDMLKNGLLVKTAQVNRGTAYDMLKKALEESDKDLLYISFSSGMSGSYDSVCAVANDLRVEFPERRIEVIDSLSGAGGEGLLYYYACKMKNEGASMDEVIAWIEENKLNAHHIFIVDDLKNLKQSGRISSIAALLGKIMHLKPILELSHEGKITLLGKALGRKKAMGEITRFFGEYLEDNKNDFILVAHTGNQADADTLANSLKALCPNLPPIKFGYINRLVAGCAGYNALAVFFMGKRRKKHILDNI
ncbi:MAG: DegV family protein [Clostridia bacterium]|nr:DegV family protein [Clostridia bacterium]